MNWVPVIDDEPTTGPPDDDVAGGWSDPEVAQLYDLESPWPTSDDVYQGVRGGTTEATSLA